MYYQNLLHSLSWQYLPVYPGSHEQRNPPPGWLKHRPCSPQTPDGMRTRDVLEGAGTVQLSTTVNNNILLIKTSLLCYFVIPYIVIKCILITLFNKDKEVLLMLIYETVSIEKQFLKNAIFKNNVDYCFEFMLYYNHS